MKPLLTLLFALCTISVFAQNLKRSDFIGTWTAKTVLIPDMEMENEQRLVMEGIKKGFVNSNYTFDSDGTFDVEFKNGIPEVMKELKFLRNTNWKFNEASAYIAIGTDDDNYTLMGIMVKKEKGKTYFMIEETPFTMEMIKNR